MQTFAAQGIRILTWEDAGYPANLLRAPDAPPVLFVRGEISQSDSRAVAVVGTRQPSPASASLARRVGHELAARGWVIVSGLAIGIDTDAHRGALDARGRTLAVLGSGVAAIYPRQNEALASEVMASGALLSEVHPLAGVDRQALITRNRITSGLSRATIVVQSTTDGGSMNTARRSLEQRRAVFLMKGEGHESFDGAISLVPDEIDWDAFSSRLDEIRIGPASNSEPSGQQPRLF
jgi:DNA processing protein